MIEMIQDRAMITVECD